MMRRIILLIVLMVSAIGVSQDTLTEGVIVQSVKLSSPNEQVNAQFETMGQMVATTYFKGNKSAAIMSNPMAGDSKSFVDLDTKIMRIFMNNPMMGKKYAETSLDLSQEDIDKVKVEPNGETKTVLGYDCKGFSIVTAQQGVETKMKMFVTDKIPVNAQQTATLGGQVKGFPMFMEMTIKQMGMDIVTTMEVVEIKKEKVSDDKLDMSIPEGYSKM